MSLNVLVTGAGGFAGGHLTEILLKEDSVGKILASQRMTSSLNRKAQNHNKLEVVELDLTERSQVDDKLESHEFDWVFHLASTSSVGLSFKEPTETYRNNVMSQVHLLETIRRQSYNPRIVLALSGEEYGIEDEGSRNGIFNPVSPYAVSKLTQDMMGYQYHKSFDLDVIRIRSFPHLGPGQEEDFLLPTIVRQLIQIERGEKPAVLELDNLSVRRDFLDVRDVVMGYVSAAEKGNPGCAYDLCSGRVISVRELVRKLLDRIDSDVEIKESESKHRPVNPTQLKGDPEPLKTDTGWEPEIPIERTLMDTMAYWRKRLDS